MQVQRHRQEHGRYVRWYDQGETFAQYGIARVNSDGEYEFVCYDWGKWSLHMAYRAPNPPNYLFKRYKDTGAFIINFNKPSAPQPRDGFSR